MSKTITINVLNWNELTDNNVWCHHLMRNNQIIFICWQWLLVKMTVSCHNRTMRRNVTNIVWTGNVNHEFMICDSIDIMIGPNNCLHLTECELELWFYKPPTFNTRITPDQHSQQKIKINFIIGVTCRIMF